MRNADCRMRSEKTGLRIQKGGGKTEFRTQESEDRTIKNLQSPGHLFGKPAFLLSSWFASMSSPILLNFSRISGRSSLMRGTRGM